MPVASASPWAEAGIFRCSAAPKGQANSISEARPKRQATELSTGTGLSSWNRMTCQVLAQISVGIQNSQRGEIEEVLID